MKARERRGEELERDQRSTLTVTFSFCLRHRQTEAIRHAQRGRDECEILFFIVYSLPHFKVGAACVPFIPPGHCGDLV